MTDWEEAGRRKKNRSHPITGVCRFDTDINADGRSPAKAEEEEEEEAAAAAAEEQEQGQRGVERKKNVEKERGQRSNCRLVSALSLNCCRR